MDKEQINSKVRKFRMEWHYLLIAFYLFILISALLYFPNSRNFAFGIAGVVFFLYFLLLWLESFFRKESQAKGILSVGSLNAFFALIAFVGGAFLNAFVVWNYVAYWIVYVIGAYFLSVSLQKASWLGFNYLEHKLDSNSFVRTPENLRKIQLFWRILIVTLIILVVIISYVFTDDRSGMYMFFIIISFFTSFVMFRFTTFMDDSPIKKHLNGTSNAAFISVIFFLFTWIFDSIGIIILPWITLLVATFFFAVSMQKVAFIGWFVR